MGTRLRFFVLALSVSMLLVLPGFSPVQAAGFLRSALMNHDRPAERPLSRFSTPEPLILNETQSEYQLGTHIDILEDPGGELTIDQVVSEPFRSSFLPSQAEVPNFGYTSSVYWVRLPVENGSQRNEEWLLEIGFPNIHYVDLYEPLPGGDEYVVTFTGSLRPVSTRDIVYPHIVFDLSIPRQSSQTYYLRFDSEASMTLAMTLWNQEAFWTQAQPKLMIQWLIFGSILALLVYHLAFLSFIKEPSYLFFVILLASLLVLIASYQGFLGVYLIPQLYLVKAYFPLVLSVLFVSIILFSDAFLELRTRNRILHLGHITFTASWGILMLLAPFVSYLIMSEWMTPFALVTLAFICLAGVISWREGFHPARIFMVAWLGMLAGLFLMMMVRMGIAPSTTFTENIYQPGMLLMAVGWSIGLANRMNRLKSEYRVQLETLIEERTAELNAANKELRLRLEWLAAVNLVNQTAARSADSRLIYGKILEIVNHLFEPKDSFIAELDRREKQLNILAHSCRDEQHPDLIGSVTSLPKNVSLDPNSSQGKLVFLSKEQIDTFTGPLCIHVQISKLVSTALVPLQLRDQVIGFLGLELHEERRAITNEKSILLSIFSTDIAQIMENTHLFDQAKMLIATEERNRLARDLHDSVTQVLFSATLVAEVLPQTWARDPERAMQSLEKLRRLTRGALAEMRTMLLELRPSAVIRTPLGELLTQLTDAVTSRSGLPFQLFIEKIPILPDDVQMNFYHVAQEALNNVVKHSQAKHVIVNLSKNQLLSDEFDEPEYEIRLIIQDDDVGFFSGGSQVGRLGISIMRERAAAIQAAFSIESEPGYGTLMTLIWARNRQKENQDG